MRIEIGLLVAACFVALPVFAGEEIADSRADELERRIERLEGEATNNSAEERRGNDWSRYVRLGGSAEMAYFHGERDSDFDPETFLIWDARFFVDADLGDRVEVADLVVVRNLAMTFEWDLVRRGSLKNRVGDLYVDMQGILDQDFLNLQFGRFQLPVGEAYHRYGQGRKSKPFISDSVGGPWYWDEGARLYGSIAEDRLGYVFSVTDGDTSFNKRSNNDEQYSLKLHWRPTSWLYLSASGLISGKLGNSDSAASGSLWLGESWARGFGARSSVTNYQNGIPIPDGPNELTNTRFVGADAIATLPDKFRLWLAYGRYSIDSRGGSTYDRILHYWIVEVVAEGAWISSVLRPFYLGFRASGLGTYDSDRGYLVDAAQKETIGYNAESVTDYSTVLGWRLNRWVQMRLEYTHRDLELVRGVASPIEELSDKVDYFAAGIGVAF